MAVAVAATARPCPDSLCNLEPEHCSSSLSGSEYATLAAIVLIPIAAAVVLPIISSTCSARLNVLADPPMVGCGARLLPRECATTGILVVTWVVVVGFVVVFFSLLLDPRPCETALGKCGSISCICGNVYVARGYTWMFFSLVLTATLLVRDISLNMRGTSRRQRANKGLMIAGAMLLSLTGLFPETMVDESLDEDAAQQTRALQLSALAMHICGIGLGTVLLSGVPFLWHLHEVALPAWRQARPGRLCLVSVRLLYFSLLSGFALSFAALVEFADTTDYCAALETPAACAAWPDFANATGCNASLPVPRAHWLAVGHFSPKYDCAWRVRQPSAQQELLLPAAYLQSHAGLCVRRACPLFAFARSVALEFATLVLAFTYTLSFGLGDAKRLALVVQPTPSGAKPFVLLRHATSWTEAAETGLPSPGEPPRPLQPEWLP